MGAALMLPFVAGRCDGRLRRFLDQLAEVRVDDVEVGFGVAGFFFVEFGDRIDSVHRAGDHVGGVDLEFGVRRAEQVDGVAFLVVGDRGDVAQHDRFVLAGSGRGDAERVRDAFRFFVQFVRPADGVSQSRSFVELAGVVEHAVMGDEEPFRGARFEFERAVAFEADVVKDRIRFVGDVDVGVGGGFEDRRGARRSRQGLFLRQSGGRSPRGCSGPLPARPGRRPGLR